MPLSRVLAAVIIASSIGFGAAVYGQQLTAMDHYNKGREFVVKSRWEDAIKELTNAIAMDPVAGMKRGDGTVSDPYYPHFWLAYALAKLERWSDAKQRLAEVDERGLQKDEKQRYQPLRQQVCIATLDPMFTEAARKGIDAADSGHYIEAIRQLLEAKKHDDCSQYDQRKLADKARTAADGYRKEIGAAVSSAQTLAKDAKSLDEAYSAFKTIEGRLVAENDVASSVTNLPRADVTAGMKTIDDRRAKYATDKAAAEQAEKGGDLQKALNGYTSAKNTYPQQAERDKLDDRIASVNGSLATQGMAAQAQDAYKKKDYNAAFDLAGKVLEKDPGRQDMTNVRRQADSRLASAAADGLVASRKYADAKAKYAEARAKDAENQEAVQALDRFAKFDKLGDRVRDLAKQPAANWETGLQAAMDLEAADRDRFAAETEWSDARTKFIGAVRKEIAQARTDIVDNEDYDKASKTLEPLREKTILEPADRADVSGFLAIVYHHRFQEGKSEDEKSKWKTEATAMFKQALSFNGNWTVPKDLTNTAVDKFFKEIPR